MAENTKIEWTDHTFNAWWGCVKVHTGCKNCYAETWDARWGGDHWGPAPRHTRRMILGEWSKPKRWNDEAREALTPSRVFCMSMGDLFELFEGDVVDQQGNQVIAPAKMVERYGPVLGPGNRWTLPALRWRTLDMVRETPWLRWMLLTKRPENVMGMVPGDWLEDWPTNVAVGVSPCNQETANASIPHLLRIPGRRFLSCEPLEGPIDFAKVPDEWDRPPGHGAPTLLGDIDEVIVGGESGRGARPLDVSWVRSIVEQCREAEVPCFVKQLGARPVMSRPTCAIECGCGLHHGFKDPKGGDPEEWPESLRVREQAAW